jgi:unsaturated rhamnogalacturonyl hydrolase
LAGALSAAWGAQQAARTAVAAQQWDTTAAASALEGIDGLWQRTAAGEYFRLLQNITDTLAAGGPHFAASPGAVGNGLLTLYLVTGERKYFQQATSEWQQLQALTRPLGGGGGGSPAGTSVPPPLESLPFFARYAALVRDAPALDAAAKWTANYARGSAGAPFSGFDAPRMAAFGSALVGVLDALPSDHPARADLVGLMGAYTDAVVRPGSAVAGLWRDEPQALGAPSGPARAASCLVANALAKAARRRWLPPPAARAAAAVARGAFAGAAAAFSVGGAAASDGVSAGPAALGACLMAANEMEAAALPKPGRGRVVLLDSYFNNESRIDQSGHAQSWHYKWGERGDGGFSFLAGVFERAGFELRTLYGPPTAAALEGAAVYIIVDPDTGNESSKPNYVGRADVDAIRGWVGAGGALVLMGNNVGNCELTRFNDLASAFGLRFAGDTRGRVPGTEFAAGKVVIPAGNEIFAPGDLFIKEYSSLQLAGGTARAVLRDDGGAVVVAVSSYGQGRVFAVGDPWLYNEYVDGRRLPPSYGNFQAAADLVDWLASASPKP